MAKCRKKHTKKNKSYNTKVSPTWTEATLLTIARHHNSNGELAYSESIFKRSWTMPDNYERVWEQNDLTEEYQQRIAELLNNGQVVLKVVG